MEAGRGNHLKKQRRKRAGDMSDYRIDTVWEKKNETIKNEIIEFWTANKALPREKALTRVEQVACVGRDTAGNIAGVGTAFPKFNKQLENSFYYYRSFVSAEHRRSQLALELLQFTQQLLEEIYISGDNIRCIGMIVELQNKALQEHLNLGVWPRTGFVYIGNNQYDQHVRVYYFKGAKIS